MPGMRHEALCGSLVLSAVVLAGCGTPAEPSAPPGTPAPPPDTTTFMVSGWVADSGSRLLAGARVEVLTGARAGTVLATDEQGRFAFDQPLDRYVRVRASMAGYVDEIRVVGQTGVTGSTQSMGFQLTSPNGSIDLTGRHRITFTADAACADLPPVARERSYLANITTKVDLYGATFGGDPGGDYLWRVLYLSQFENYAKFWLQDPPVWELLPDNGYVLFWGDAAGTVSKDGGTLPLSGFVSYCAQMSPGPYPVCAVEEVSCRSSRHQMTMVRR